MSKNTMTLSREKINIAIARKNYSVAELAKDCKVTRQRMTAILNAERVAPSTAGKIAKALNADVTEIIN